MFFRVFERTFKCAFKYLLILDSPIIPPTKATGVHTQAQLCLSFSTSPHLRLRKENHLWFGIAHGFQLIILTGSFLQELLLCFIVLWLVSGPRPTILLVPPGHHPSFINPCVKGRIPVPFESHLQPKVLPRQPHFFQSLTH